MTETREYEPTEKLAQQIEKTFTYQAPKEDQLPRYVSIRDKFKELALLLAKNCPDSRELSAAMTLLQNANMMANASIAVNE